MEMLVNIDNGGTFTDVCVTDGERLVHTKTPTTPHDLTRCFVDGLRLASAQLYGRDDLTRLLSETAYLRYSTTSGTNAMVQRAGTPVALLVERGFEQDAYGAATGMDADLWRAMVPARPAGVTVGPDGQVALDELTAAVNALLAAGARRLVVALRREDAEQAVKRALLERYPRHMLGAVPFLLSHELIHDDDHARRVSTAVVNSYLHPGMEHFLYGAQRACSAGGLPRPLLIFGSDGNSARVARSTAIKTWGSGPRGGLEGGLAYARLYDVGVLVTMDIGGTTTDVAVIVDGSVRQRASGQIDSARTSIPLPELSSFALGGSSVVEVVDGQVVIGPHSVGAAPGPACFARGGTRATLTDALLLLGVLNPDRYLGGTLRLDVARAEAAIAAAVGTPLGLSVPAAALAVLRSFEAGVGAHLRDAIVATGHDPAEATLLAFGGGGPMVASGVARAAGISRVIVAHLSAVFSAFGMGFSPLAHEHLRPLPADAASVGAVRDELLARARRDMFGEGVDVDACRYDTAIRTIVDDTVTETAVTDEAGSVGSASLPAGARQQLLLRAVFDLPTFRLEPDRPLPPRGPTPVGHRTVRGEDGQTRTIAVLDATALSPGDTAPGPVLVAGDYLTCLVESDWSMRVSCNHDLILEDRA